MQRYFFLLVLFSLFIFYPAKAQPFDSLHQLKEHAVEIYYSSGHQQRAVSIALRVDKAMMYYQELLGFKPVVTLLVLSKKDWSRHTSLPVIYGMPHYNGDKRLIVAAEDNPFWKSFLPPLEQLPQNLREQVQSVYKSGDSLSMQAFFDLLAIHELGHAFHLQGKLQMQRKWMGELFVNILLHTYIAEKEPASLPALTLFPRMVVAGGAKEFKYTSLKDMEERYNEIPQQYPKNYGWYQCRWHSAAGDIYDAVGKQAGKKLWEAFKTKKEIVTDEQLISFLETNVHKTVADVMRNWDQDIIK